MAVFITLEEPTRDMQVEAVSAGFYHSPGWNLDFPVIQIMTIRSLLAGERLQMPPAQTTFKKAEKVNTIKLSQKKTGSVKQAYLQRRTGPFTFIF